VLIILKRKKLMHNSFEVYNKLVVQLFEFLIADNVVV
jgi:hypothetical protein